MRACALTYRELPCEFVSNPTAPTSQRERKFWDRQITDRWGLKGAMKDMISVIMLLTPEITSFIGPFNPSVCPFARAGTWAQSGCDDPQAEASPHLDPMLNT